MVFSQSVQHRGAAVPVYFKSVTSSWGLASIVLILFCNYDILSLEQLSSKFSAEFSDVQSAFLKLQGTENHFTAGLKGSLCTNSVFISS